jgi:general secretion pathway protein D
MIRLFSLALALVVGVAALSPARAQDGVQLNFTNTDIETVIKAVGEYTGRTFVLDPRVKGSINIVSAKPVPRSAIYPALLSSLRMAGFAVVESGGFTRVLPEIEAKTYAVPGQTGPGAGPSGTVLTTRVFVLQNESAPQVLNVIRPLVAPNNSIVAFAPGNALIVTDYADNLRRIEELINLLDNAPRSSAAEPQMSVLKNANASDVAQLLRNVFQDPAAGAEPRDRVVIAFDARLNAILLRSDNPGRIARAQAMIAQLDQPQAANAGTGNVHIIRLRNADAIDLALTLRRVLGAEGPASAAPTNTQPNLSSLLTQSNSSIPAAQIGANSNQISPNASASPSSFAPASQPVSFTAGGATIFADAANNTLIVNAPDLVMRNLKAVIEQLDVRRAQVFIEALIVEMSAEKAAEFGVQWQALSGLNNGDFRFLGGTNVANPAAIGAASGNVLGLAGALGQNASGSRGLSLGALREITIPGIGTVYSLAALAKALEKDAKANILSVPTLMTLDNHEAKFSSGQNLPFLTGQYAVTGNATSPTPFQTIERRDVGLTLRVKPQITEGGAIRLAIYQEVSSVLDLGISSGTGPITNKRFIDTTVMADDGSVVALGGLLQDSFTDGEDKVPLLGDVPVLGNLFKYDSRKRAKTSLMLFLRPTILRNATDTARHGADRYDQLLNDPAKPKIEPTWFWPDASAPNPQFPVVPPKK